MQGLVFRGVAVRATVDGQVAWLRCTSTSSREVQLVQLEEEQEKEEEEEEQVELFDAVTPPPHLQLQLARN